MDGGRFKHDIPLYDSHISGTWSRSQTELSFTETSGGECLHTPGTYACSYEGTKLHLAKHDDPCEVLAGYDWIKQP